MSKMVHAAVLFGFVGLTSCDLSELPDTPKNVRASFSEDRKSITVAWDEADDADTYDVCMNYDGPGGNNSGACDRYSGMKDVYGTSIVWEKWSTSDPGTVYKFRVMAKNEKGESAWSAFSSPITE